MMPIKKRWKSLQMIVKWCYILLYFTRRSQQNQASAADGGRPQSKLIPNLYDNNQVCHTLRQPQTVYAARCATAADPPPRHWVSSIILAKEVHQSQHGETQASKKCVWKILLQAVEQLNLWQDHGKRARAYKHGTSTYRKKKDWRYFLSSHGQ